MRCGRLLDVQTAYEVAQRERLKDDILLRLASLLLTRGMADDAAKIIHDAGLGPTLQELVRRDLPTDSISKQA